MELRDALAEFPDLVVLYVMAANQINTKAQRFIDEAGLRDRVRFLSDPESLVIERLGLRRENPEPIEEGVAHPATYLLDEEGRVVLMDVRTDFHIWLDPQVVVAALREGPAP